MAIPNETNHVPLLCGLFTEDLIEIEGSRCWQTGSDPSTIPPPTPTLLPCHKLGGTQLFGGLLSGHFGHMLCEGTARLWALDAFAEPIDGIVFFSRDPRKAPRFAKRIQRLFEVLQIDLPTHVVTQPTVLERVVVASQGFGTEDLLCGTQEFRAFMRSRLQARDTVQDSGRKLYISRALQPKRRGYTIGEAALQNQLNEAGFEMFHPERHGLEAQAAAYRDACHIVACEGSPLHLVGFAAPLCCPVVIVERRRGPTVEHIKKSLTMFLGRAPDIVRGDRSWRTSAPGADLTYLSVPISKIGRAMNLNFADQTLVEVDSEIVSLQAELGLQLEEIDLPSPSELPVAVK